MKIKRIIPFVCIFLLVSVFSSTAMACEPEMPENDPFNPSRYTYIATINICFDISSSGLTDDYCKVYIPDTTCSCWLDMYLQRWNSNTEEWETVKSWSKYGVETITLEKEWYDASGYIYRLKCVVSVYDSNNLLGEAVAAYSSYYYY